MAVLDSMATTPQKTRAPSNTIKRPSTRMTYQIYTLDTSFHNIRY